MRDATLSLDSDFDDDGAPASRKRALKPRKVPSRLPKKRKRLAFDVTKIARYATIAMSAIITGGIMINALVMQKGRHPAPLFGKAILLGQSETAAKAPVKAASALDADPAARATAAPSPQPPPKPHHLAEAETGSAASDDPIARLLNGSGAATGAADSQTVLGVQQALVKLGLMSKATGALGPATKKAIAKFEKERHMPVNGEVSRRLVKVLSAESGLKID